MKTDIRQVERTRSQHKNGIEQTSILDFIMISKDLVFKEETRVYPHRIGTSDHFLIEAEIGNLGLIKNRMKERFSSKKINEKINRDLIAKIFCEEVLSR